MSIDRAETLRNARWREIAHGTVQRWLRARYASSTGVEDVK